jgi:hypothetical protein
MVLVLWYMHGDDGICYGTCIAMIISDLVHPSNVMVH